MGLFSGLRGLFGGGKKKVKVLCVGLDNSGKSTVINRLKTRKAGDVELAPTVGFATEDFTKGGLQLSVYDMSGQGRYRNLWETFYKNVNAIIFVIDATDKLRMCVVKDELDSLLAHKDLGPVPILFLANKMDLPNALSTLECVAALGLDSITDKPYNVFATDAMNDRGLKEAEAWLLDQMSR